MRLEHSSSGLRQMSLLGMIAMMACLSSCGVNSGNNIFNITAENDFEGTSVITSGTNAPITIPVIVNDTVVQLVDINFDSTGQSGNAFDYDNTVTPYNATSQMSFHINGGNPDRPMDGPDMAGSVSLDPTSDFTQPDTVQLIYTPTVTAGFGVDWFSYTPLGINGASDTAYAFVRYIRIAADQYEPDDFIQFARDITDYVFPAGTHHRETHNSDYHNPSHRLCTAYRALAGMSIRGDRDWFLIRLPTGVNTLNLTVKASIPHQQSFTDINGADQSTENELCISLIEEVTGVPPPRASGNGPVAQRFTQNPDIPPRPYHYGSTNGGGSTMIQLNRNNEVPTPDTLWFKWPLDDDSGFPTTVGTGKVFVRIHPRPGAAGVGCTPGYQPHGEYRVDFLLE